MLLSGDFYSSRTYHDKTTRPHAILHQVQNHIQNVWLNFTIISKACAYLFKNDRSQLLGILIQNNPIIIFIIKVFLLIERIITKLLSFVQIKQYNN